VLRAQDRKEEAQAYEAVFRGLAERALAEGRSTPGPSLRDAFARRSRPAARRAPPTDDLDADDLAAIRATAPAPESVLYNDELSDENGGREEDDDTGTGGKPGT